MDNLFKYFTEIIAVLVLVLANGFFVAVEFAIVRSHITKFKEPQLIGKLGTRSALKLISSLDLSLSATQLGITVASLVLGWYGESIFAEIFYYFFANLDLDRSVKLYLSHGAATACALIVVTFLHVVIGELAAKSLAIRYPETTLRLLAAPMVFFTEACRPIIFILNECANLFLSLFGLNAITESERVHNSSELSMLVAASKKYGVLDKDEEQMLQGVFHFSETVAREIMTPRTDVMTIQLGCSYEQAIEKIIKSGFSRFPVIGENIDDVKGVLLARDLLRASQKLIRGQTEKLDPCSLIREPYFIPGTKSINELLGELKNRKTHMAIVLDEHGGFDGVVTLEDIIEEIVGDIFDESDRNELYMIRHDNGDILIDGGVLASDINEELEINIPEGDYDTLAGFIFSVLGRMAVEGDSIVLNPIGYVSVNGSAFELPKGSPQKHDIDQLLNEVELSLEDEEEKQNLKLCEFIVQQVVGNRIESVLFRLSDTSHDQLKVLFTSKKVTEDVETSNTEQPKSSDKN
jgi:CBS domain containing-hemolysin-like protein